MPPRACCAMSPSRRTAAGFFAVAAIYDAAMDACTSKTCAYTPDRLDADDGIGNSTIAAFNGVTNVCTANNLNQYASIVCASASPCETVTEYDADGNMTQCGDWTYTCDAANRLTAVSSNGVLLVTNDYDAKGRRVRKVTPESTTTFFYDGWNLIEERVANTNGTASTIHYYWGKDLSGTLQGAAYLNDLLGTTVGTWGGRAAQKRKEKRRYSAAALTAFGEPPPGAAGGAAVVPSPFFTGKPDVPGLGRVFLMRSYRPGLAKWQTAAPLGYPDGWNQLAYCKNEVTRFVDYLGAACTEWCRCGSGSCGCGVWVYPSLFGDGQHYFMGRDGMPIFNPENEIMNYMEDNFPGAHYFAAVHDSWVGKLVDGWGLPDLLVNIPSMPIAYVFGFFSTSYDKFADFINYLQDQLRMPNVKPIWLEYCSCKE